MTALSNSFAKRVRDSEASIVALMQQILRDLLANLPHFVAVRARPFARLSAALGVMGAETFRETLSGFRPDHISLTRGFNCDGKKTDCGCGVDRIGAAVGGQRGGVRGFGSHQPCRGRNRPGCWLRADGVLQHVDGSTLPSSRFRFTGSGELDNGLAAGVHLSTGLAATVRHAWAVYVASEGRRTLTIGHTRHASDGMAHARLGGLSWMGGVTNWCSYTTGG